MQNVSAIVVTHNSEAELGACLDALRECGQVIVVDNASSDRSIEVAAKRPWVEVLASPENRGFAAAVNQGARASRHPLLLILNPDAVIEGNCDELLAACERSGIAAGCLTNLDGTVQAGFTVRRLPSAIALSLECLGVNRLWPGNPVNARYRCLDLDLTKPGPVEQPAGAFLMIRRDVFHQLGGFDERFWPVWYEDVDFCRRAFDAGHRIQYVPGARARHSGGHSVQTIEPKHIRLYWYGSLLKYADKHYRTLAFRTVCCCVALGSLFRLSAGVVFRRGRDPRSEYGKVLQLAAVSLVAGKFRYPAASSSWGEGRQHLQSHPADGR